MVREGYGTSGDNGATIGANALKGDRAEVLPLLARDHNLSSVPGSDVENGPRASDAGSGNDGRAPKNGRGRGALQRGQRPLGLDGLEPAHALDEVTPVGGDPVEVGLGLDRRRWLGLHDGSAGVRGRGRAGVGLRGRREEQTGEQGGPHAGGP